jgi:hypothetical protein
MRSLSGMLHYTHYRFAAENLFLSSPFIKFGCQRVAAVLKQTETVVPERFA